MNSVFWTGFATSLALIVAIGSQNAFVLRQGILRQHVATLVLFCAMSDAILIVAGVAGLGALVQSSPVFLEVTRMGGALFLTVYGARELLCLHLFEPARLPGHSGATGFYCQPTR